MYLSKCNNSDWNPNWVRPKTTRHLQLKLIFDVFSDDSPSADGDWLLSSRPVSAWSGDQRGLLTLPPSESKPADLSHLLLEQQTQLTSVNSHQASAEAWKVKRTLCCLELDRSSRPTFSLCGSDDSFSPRESLAIISGSNGIGKN